MLLFAPCMLSPVVVAFIWQFIYMPDGMLNHLLGTDITWLGNRKTALFCVVIAHVWMWIGYSSTIYMSNLQSISTDILEAAAIDGRGRAESFKSITLPMLAPSTTINVTLAFTQSLKVFDIVYAMTKGGPLNSTETVGTYVVANMNRGLHGYASAQTVLLTIDDVLFRASVNRSAEKKARGGDLLMKTRKKQLLFLFELLMAAACILMFYPVIMMVLVSLKDEALLAGEPLSLRTSFAFENYVTAAKGNEILESVA